jgi:hypothetical protein
LNSAAFSYNKAIAFPAPYSTRNMVSGIIVRGTSAFIGLGSGADTALTIGGGTTYDYDTFIDVGVRSVLQLNNVLFVNRNNSR